jgi:zinc/manganese transport system permease protein
LWVYLRGRTQRLGFYALFACAVTVSVQLVGVYLVFASLIIPALASRPYPPARQLAAGYATGMLGYALGLLASAWFDLPAGAIIVWAMAIIACLCHLVGSGLSRTTPPDDA